MSIADTLCLIAQLEREYRHATERSGGSNYEWPIEIRKAIRDAREDLDKELRAFILETVSGGTER